MPLQESHVPREYAPICLAWTAATVLLLFIPCKAGAQTASFDPDALAKQRTTLYVRATQSALADMESEINHLALLSESCRAEYGSKACVLPEKPLRSEKLEERYAYYVKRPVDSRWEKHQVKVSRHNWEGSSTSASK